MKKWTATEWVWALVVVLILTMGPVLAWYRASVQTALYQREGLEITVWEVMLGAKPAERVIHLKP